MFCYHQYIRLILSAETLSFCIRSYQLLFCSNFLPCLLYMNHHRGSRCLILVFVSLLPLLFSPFQFSWRMFFSLSFVIMATFSKKRSSGIKSYNTSIPAINVELQAGAIANAANLFKDLSLAFSSLGCIACPPA